MGLERERLASHWVGYETIATKEVRRVLRIWPQTLLPPVITTTLYFIIFGPVLGERIGAMASFTYMQYITPGLIMMAVITNAYTNTVSSFFSAKFQRHVEEMLVSPMPNAVLLLGYITGGVFRSMAIGLIVAVVALLFTDLAVHSVAVTASVALLTAVLFALGGFINGMLARKFDDVAIVPTFILTPLTFLGGVFYSIDLLTPFWQVASRANPILYMVNAFRYGILGSSDIAIETAYLVIGLFIVALTAASLLMLRTGVGLRK